ncbi:MAG: glycoside hydrolase family 3 C-terminal domain-containing protein [Butyrivibrio sp.]|nr:glycoside hydrolase family 3 C-terminal domain-containing protein [Butyrivibrio sp.]
MKKIVLAGTDKNPGKIELDNRELAREAAAEGFVLLKNDGTLPLTNKKIALFGSGVRMTVKGGTGSGAVRERYSVTIEEGMKNAGYEVTSNDWLDRFDKFYDDTYEAYRSEMEEKVKGVMEFHKILHMIPPFRHPTGIPVTQDDIAEASNDCDTAIYVLARQAGEGNDRKDVAGDYGLDNVEIENLRAVSRGFKNFVVVINCGGVIDVSFLDELHVSSLVYFVQGGEEGGNALADVLSGKKNFSGKLATGWAYKFEDIPSNSTYSYLGGDDYNQEYNEGIYVGYRYFDTFKVNPRFRFGYGLSYTSFDIECEKAVLSGEELLVDVEVTNTGDVDGKEVVQLYATVPYGETGAEYQRLVSFKKTGVISAGKSEVITLTVKLRDFTCYEEKDSSFVLRKGQYIIRLGNDSCNTKAVLVLKNENEQITEKCFAACPVEHEINEIKAPERENEDLKGVKTINIPEGILPCIEHTYEELPVDSDPYVDTMTDEQLIKLIVGGGTSNDHLQVEAMGASGTTNPDNYEELGIPNAILSDGPAGLNLTCRIVEMEDGSYKAARVPEVLEAYKRYLFGVAGMGMKARMADPADGTEHYQYATAWPCSQLLAQSFNTELLERVGDAVGKEMEAYGVTIWLAPGMNIHRNPLCGRTFEYYSEDPYVSGKMASAIVRGVQKHPGKGMSVKHFACNNCELERNRSSSNVSERALREIYLKGFEIAVKESEPMTVMAAYNKINGVYCTNNYDLLVKILRQEWGFKGMVMSDWDSMKADREDCMKAATGDVLKASAAQCDLICPGRPDQIKALGDALEQGIIKRDDVKRCATRVLSMIRKNTVLESK